MDNPIKILFVEDLPSDLELVERELRQHGIRFEGIRAETREEFLNGLTSFQPDIVISDYSLPSFNGMEALFLTQNISPATPFIILTGSTNEETAVECMKAGANDYVIKEHLSRIVPAMLAALSKAKMIAEKSMIERELIKSNERFHFALQGVHAGVWEWNLQNDHKIFSREWARLIGYEPEEIPVEPEFWKTTVHPDDLPQMLYDLESYLVGNIGHYENVHRKHTKNGDWIWVLDRGEIVERDHENKPTHIIGIIVDITKQKAMEQELIQSEQKFRKLFENANDAIFIIKDSKVVDCNQKAATLFGMSKLEFIGIIPETLSPEVQPNGESSTLLAKQHGVELELYGQVLFEWRFLLSDGKEFDSEVNLSRVEIGNEVYVQGIVRDITDRKRVEADRERLMAAIEQTNEAFVITDANGIILYVNPAFETTTGYSHDEAIGQNPRFLQSGKHDKEFYAKIWEALLRGEVWRGHFFNKHKNGAIFEEESTITPIHDTYGKTVNYVAVKRNITRERQLEDQLQQSQKMEAIGRLAGGVAHDFNNLLTIIHGNAELLSLMASQDDRIQEGLQLIRQTVDRGTALTRQLLAFSRRQQHQPIILNLNEVLQGMQKMLGRLIGEDIELHYLLDNNLPNAKADLAQMEQVVMNLVVNARDAMPSGGKLIISTSITNFHAGELIEPSPIQPGSYCTFSIADTGVGMTKEVREKALEPFFTTKPVGKGTGLGLSMVHGIIVQSGGMVHIESEPGNGTTIYIYLPVVDEALEKTTVVTHDNILGKNEHILVIEDEKAILDMVKLILTQYGYQVTAARNGKEALALLLRETNGFQLILTDVIMPHISGPQLVEWVKSRHPGTKVVYTSGYTTEAVVHQIQDQGFPFLQKPFKTNELLKAIRMALDAK